MITVLTLGDWVAIIFFGALLLLAALVVISEWVQKKWRNFRGNK